MPARYLMSDLVTRCKRRADKENDDSITTAEWKQLIAEVYNELFQLVANTGGRYFEYESTITANGATSYDEPDDMSKFVSVEFVSSDGRRRPLTPLEVQEQHAFAGRTGEAFYFALVDDQIFLYPKPTTGTYKVRYVPQATDLSEYADDGVVDVVCADGLSFLLWGVAVLALGKSRQDVTLAIRQTDRYRESMVSWAADRMLHDQHRRVQVEDDMGYFDPADWRWSR